MSKRASKITDPTLARALARVAAKGEQNVIVLKQEFVRLDGQRVATEIEFRAGKLGATAARALRSSSGTAKTAGGAVVVRVIR